MTADSLGNLELRGGGSRVVADIRFPPATCAHHAHGGPPILPYLHLVPTLRTRSLLVHSDNPIVRSLANQITYRPAIEFIPAFRPVSSQRNSAHDD